MLLNRVVETHIQTAHPVGSKALLERHGFPFSSATIRHEMGFLEDKGFLTHTHTSSGRIPTDQGYRYYVDHCLEQARGQGAILEAVKQDFQEIPGQWEHPDLFLEEASRILACLAHELSLVLTIGPYVPGLRSFPPRVYLQGSAHILEKPEFQDVSKARSLFGILGEREKIRDCVSPEGKPGDGLAVTIGEENTHEALKDCTVVSSRYCTDSETRITFAVVGPKRMNYAGTIPVVDSVAKMVVRIFNERWA